MSLAAPVALAIAAAGYETRNQWLETDEVVASPVPAEIVVRGRLEPSEGIFAVAAHSIAPTTALGEILVQEGQAVRKGDIVATLRSRGHALAGLEAAKAALEVAERRVDLTRRPYKPSVIVAQEAAVQARVADLALAQAQSNRGDILKSRGVLSEETRELRVAEVSRARALLDEARARLKAETEVPASEILLAEAEAAAVRAKLQGAREELALTEIRAPADGLVLKVHAKSGELVSHRPILDIGNIGQPKIVAEVDERLVPRLRLGQPVRASIRGQDGEWAGTIFRIGGGVLAQTRPAADPVTGPGGRIVEVDAVIADPTGLPRIAGLELIVRIRAP